ncbi:hypothetical protein AGMMS49556_09730 [Endomicrobiia bacterium]|nr:hypothetical protein AGMMS49556_09730 [Endomicrobiia bacterium]
MSAKVVDIDIEYSDILSQTVTMSAKVVRIGRIEYSAILS